MNHLRSCPSALTLAALLCAGQFAFATDGVEPIGLSTQSLIRGGADVAVGDSALDQIDNPATLTLLPRQFDASGELLMPRTHWTAPIDSADSRFRYLPLGHVGQTLPINDRLSLGIAGWSKSQLGSTFTLRHPSYPWLERRVGADLRDFSLGLNAAYRVTDKLSLGAGVRGELITGDFTSVSGPAKVRFDRGWGAGAGFQLGMHYQLTPRLALGVGYRSPTWFQDLLGHQASASFTSSWQGSLPGIIPINLGNATVDDVVLPQRVAAGLAWNATDRLRLTTEGRWINYSASMLHRADFVVGDPFNLQVRTPIGYRDQWAVMAGAEYKLTETWTVGGGYHFCTQPIPRDVMLPLVDMIVQHHLTVGATYKTKRWWAGGGYVLGLPNTLTAAGRAEPPLGLDYMYGHVHQIQHSLFAGFGFYW